VIIEPAGFAWDDSKLRRAGMDYLDIAAITRVPSWAHYRQANNARRIILLTTKSAEPYTGFKFRANDIILLGRESAGVPEEVHKQADARLTIPMQAGARSLNVALSCAMVTGEAVRQTL
jgi:tRNA (cytidine/uridine-2'-O-)-methyltransferase